MREREREGSRRGRYQKKTKKQQRQEREETKNLNALFSPETLSLPHAISCPPAITQSELVVPAAQGESSATGVRPVSPTTCLGECSSFWTVWPRRP